MRLQLHLPNLLLALALSVPLMGHASAAAQTPPESWQALGGPDGPLTYLAAAPDRQTLYAVTTARVNRADDESQWLDRYRITLAEALYRSTDAGVTWRPATNDLPPGTLSAVYVDPASGDLLTAAQPFGDFFTRRYGLWRSRDDGANWQQVPLGRNDLVIRRIVRNPDGSALFLGATAGEKYPNSYVYRYAGGQWTSVQALRYEQRPGSILLDLFVHGSDPQRLFLLTYGGDVFTSADAGQTWALSPRPDEGAIPDARQARLALRPDQPDTLLLVRERGSDAVPAVYRSSDAAASWRKLSTAGLPAGANPQALQGLPGGVFILDTSAGALRSADNGLTWQPLEGPLSSGVVTEFLALPAPTSSQNPVILAATGHGLYISRDAGALWQRHGSGLPFNSKIGGLLTHPARPGLVYAISDPRFVGSSFMPPSLLRSNDGGASWTPASQGLPDVSITAAALDPDDPNAIFLASWEYFFRSADGGVSWQASRLDFSSHSALAIAPSDPNTLYLGGRPSLRSADRGATWEAIPVVVTGESRQVQEAVGVVVDPTDAAHVWIALRDGVFESRDGGQSWQAIGLAGREIRWLAAATTPALTLYAGIADDGIYRWRGGSDWGPANAGLPPGSAVLAFAADPRTPGLLWATRNGGGVYRSRDGGETWTNVAIGVGDNLAQAIAVDYRTPGGALMGTATAGVWAFGRDNAGPPAPSPLPVTDRAGIDARIEIVWPHNWAPVGQARLANIGLRLFMPGSLVPPSCGWRPRVTVLQANNINPAEPLRHADQGSLDGQPYPYWMLNDVDVSRANDPTQKIYFMVRVDGASTATSVWAHGADARTFFPAQDVPSGIATDAIIAVDARIQIVWPHDETGIERPVAEATLANVAVAFFKHGTRLSVPVNWQPVGVTLYGSWDQEVSRPLATEAVVLTRQSGAITYPVWEFHNIPVARATDAANLPGSPSSKLYLWVDVSDITTYPTIWAHGVDSRTFFPFKDEPIQGCVP